jgi:CRP/FNR family transcriptional regulator, transcriptional activator FtrB
MQSIGTMLRTVPGFAQLDGASFEHVAAAGNLAEIEAGDVLFRQGQQPESLHVLLDGRVSLTGTSADASSAVIDILGPSSSFVLANVLTDEPYLMGAQAITGSQLVRIGAETLRQVVASRPAAAMAMIRAMSAELGNMTRQVVDLKVRVAAQRLGTYLLSQVTEPAATKADFRLPVAKGLLAPWLGCRAENLSRAFMALRAYGVETHGSRVLLHDISRLRAYAGAITPNQTDGGAIAQPTVEKVFGDAFKLRTRQ